MCYNTITCVTFGFFGHGARGSQLLNQGLNLHFLLGRESLNNWIASEVPAEICFLTVLKASGARGCGQDCSLRRIHPLPFSELLKLPAMVGIPWLRSL